MGILHPKQATLCDKSNNKTMSTTAGFKRYTVAGEAWRGVVQSSMYNCWKRVGDTFKKLGILADHS